MEQYRYLQMLSEITFKWCFAEGPWNNRTFRYSIAPECVEERWNRYCKNSLEDLHRIATSYAADIYRDSTEPLDPDPDPVGPDAASDVWLTCRLPPLVILLNDPKILTRANVRELWCNGCRIGEPS
jgi:hypothetical protein